jgi:hypothetical protein
LSCVALTYVVGNWVVTLAALTHWTVEQGRRFVPVTVSESAGPPAGPEVCDSEPIMGAASVPAGVESVNDLDADVPIEFVTVTATVPGKAAMAAGMEAVRTVALLDSIVCPVPFQFTTESLVKFVPVTVNVKPWELQEGVDAAIVVEAESEVMVGGVPEAGLMVK